MFKLAINLKYYPLPDNIFLKKYESEYLIFTELDFSNLTIYVENDNFYCFTECVWEYRDDIGIKHIL